MLFVEPSPTAFDLKWRMFGIPVRVHPTFWLFMALLGWNFVDEGFGYLLLWIGCAFLSILVHELGHVTMGLVFGRPSSIVLYGFGGLAIGDFQLRDRWKRIAISFAGPAAGFVLYGLAWVAFRYGLPELDIEIRRGYPAIFLGLYMLLFMNLFWSLMNLVPVWPLDGGHISREVFQGALPGRGIRTSLGFSIAIAGAIAVYSILVNQNRGLPYPPLSPIFMAIFFGILAVQSFQLLQLAKREGSYWDNGTERDPEIWGR